jgi:N-acetylmuramoyl-L-alanine amidase CwlA
VKEVNQYLTGKALTGKKLKAVKGVVIHWFASPNSKATNVIRYWQSQANGVSAHDVIDLDGTVYHAVPYDSMAYQVGCPRGYTKTTVQRLSSYPNDCVIGIECAHTDMKGTMTKETYNSLVQLAAKLLKSHKLTVNDLWLHSEIVGKDYKDCHRWFTTTKPSDWPKLKNDVSKVLNLDHPVMWDGSELKKGQIGRITILKKINLWKRDKYNKLKFVRILQPGERYRVYGYDDLYKGQYNVGGGCWITQMDGYIKYETPSKKLLEKLK